ncbi:MAG TPA: DUF1963 domain-containing protein [Thermoleophilaceae bacterium]
MLREALAGLSAYDDADIRLLARERRADVVEWRWAAGGSLPHRPEPWASEVAGRDPAWLDEKPEHTVHAVGFDRDGRPVLVEVRWPTIGKSRIDEVWFHADEWSDVLTHRGPERILFASGRVVAKVSGTPDEPQLELWDWSDGRPVRSNIGSASIERTMSETYVASYDDDGELVTLSRAVEITRSGNPDVIEATLAAVDHARELVPDHVVFDGRVARRASGLRATDEVVAVLGPAVEAAVVAAVRDSHVERPFVVELRLSDESFPPFARVGGEEFRERMTALNPEGHAAVRLLFEAKPPQGETLSLLDRLRDDALAVCRELNWALSYERGHDHPDRKRASEICERLGRDWALHLNQWAWPGAADPFLVLVRIGRQYEDVDAYELARPAVGAERVAAFLESISSRAKSGDLPPDARTELGPLESALAARGLDNAAARIAGRAELSFRLQPADGDIRTRLGGGGLLPPGEEWPHAAGGRALSFLAGVDLAELPQASALPEAGWLLFYADLDNDEALGLVEPVANEDGAPARVFYVPPGSEPVAAEPPRKLRDRLVERRVVPVAQLTLPDDYELGARLELDPAAASVVEDVANSLRYGEAGWRTEEGDHWVLGEVTGAQGHPTDPGTVLLLHMAYDESLGFEFLDGGAIQFRIPETALAAGDWGAVTIEPDSG